MLSEGYYLIKPKPVLLERLRGHLPDVIDVLTDPVLWSRREADRTQWTSRDYFEQIKLLFLADLASRYDSSPSVDLQNAVNGLLGMPPWSEATFNQWWYVERLEYDGEVDQIVASVRPEVIAKLISGSQVVTNWMQRHTAKRQG